MKIATWGILALLIGSSTPALGSPEDPKVDGKIFLETFPWIGTHAASSATASTTVWWSENHWDVRGDTSYIDVAGVAQHVDGYHVDVHKAASGSVWDGHSAVANDKMVGGDNTPGVGIFHLDNYDIIGARLRNPLVLDEGKPGTITFYASRLNTAAHWWEIALSPEIMGGEFSSIPAPYPGRVVPGPIPGWGGLSANGHRYSQNSINIINVLSSDVPCSVGWHSRFALTRRLDGVSDYFVAQRPNVAALPVQIAPAKPLPDGGQAEMMSLYKWKIEITRFPNALDAVRVFLDSNKNEVFEQAELLETWYVDIPWPSVYVHLLGVAYSAAEHHPQGACYLGRVREIVWKNIEVKPVMYAATVVVPKNIGITQVPKTTGWSSHDIRDTQRFGPKNPINQAPQPNEGPIPLSGGKGIACSAPEYPCFNNKTGIDLKVDIPLALGKNVLAKAFLVYGAKGQYGFNLIVNGHDMGYVAAASNEDSMRLPGGEPTLWMKRSIEIPKAFLVAGSNAVSIRMQTGPDKVGGTSAKKGGYVDRVEIEIYYQ